MPPRSSRSNNARNNKQQQHQHQHQQPTPPITDNDSPHRGVAIYSSQSSSPNLSPPKQLPTPLPDERASSSSQRPFDDGAVAVTGAGLLLPPPLTSIISGQSASALGDVEGERGRPGAPFNLIDDTNFTSAFVAPPQPPSQRPAIPITTNTTDDFLSDLLSSDVEYHSSLGNFHGQFHDQFSNQDKDRDEGRDKDKDKDLEEEDLARTYIDTGSYNSPPFRQAPLPEDTGSPPPLPVPPRTGGIGVGSLQALRYGEGEREADAFGFGGQTRGAPMFARPANPFAPSHSNSNSNPANQHASQSQFNSPPSSTSSSSIFDTLNRTIRGYIPPSSIPSPPSVSRPVTAVSFGRVSGAASGSGGAGANPNSGASNVIARGGGSRDVRDGRVGMGPNRRVVSQQEYEREYERDEGEGTYGYGYAQGYGARGGGSRHAAPAQPSRPRYSVDLGVEHEEREGEGEEDEGSDAEQPVYGEEGNRPRYGYGYSAGQGQGYGAGYGGAAGYATGTEAGSGLAQAMRRGDGEPRYLDHRHGQSTPQTGRYDAQPVGNNTVRGHGRSVSEAGVGMGTVGRGGEGTIRGARAGLVAPDPRGTRRTQGQAQVKVRGEGDGISWARWDLLNDRRVLVLTYPTGLQMWDTSDLKSIKEVMNVRFDSDEWGLVFSGAGVGDTGFGDGLAGTVGGGQPRVRVVHAAVLPPPSRRAKVGGGKDGFEDVRPLLGMLMDSAEEDVPGLQQEKKSIFVLYSLRTHHVIKLLPISGRAETFEASGDAVVISTTAPPTLRILSAATFHTLHVIHSTSLEAFTTPPRVSPLPAAGGPNAGIGSATGSVSSSAFPTNNPSSGISLSIANAISNTLYSSSTRTSASERGSISPEGQSTAQVPMAYPAPVFALSHRLLAYASPAPGTSPTSASPLPPSSPSLLGMGIGMGLNMASKASRRLSSSSSASGPSNAASSVSSSPFGGMGGVVGGGVQAGLGKISNITQADVGHAALKVGESVFSGMKLLGGMAFEAAKSRVGGVPSAGVSVGVGGGNGTDVGVDARRGVAGGRYVSCSAPDTADADEAAAQMLKERRYSNISTVSGPGAISGSSATSSNYSPGSYLSAHHTTGPVVAPHTKGAAQYGHYVTVLDLAPLFNSALKDQDVNSTINNASVPPLPTKIDEFNASRSQPVAGLRFAQDGTSVGVITRDGHSVKVFKLHPTPSIMLSRRGVVSAGSSPDEVETETAIQSKVELERRKATQVYDLYRGRTSAVVEGVDWAKDGRWVAVGTRNRTVHVFAINPYGGKSDVRSHLEGRVRNVDVIEAPMTPLTAIAKLRGTKSAQVSAPLAFAFLSPCDIQSSPDLVPPRSPPPVSHSPSSPKVPATKHKRSTNFQDVLMFDPATGILSLRRLTLDKYSVRDQSLTGSVVSSVHALGVTSISLPGMGGAGKLSSSPSTKGNLSTAAVGTGAGVMKPADSQMELSAKESVMATWDLQRGRDWVEIKTPILPRVRATSSVNVGGTRDWLAEGEITTGSNSQRVLPRSLYLSHQFLFHTLGEDYHALIRRYQFDIPGDKIDVRTQVEISAYSSPPGISSSGSGSSVGRGGALSRDDSAFVQDFSSSPHSHSHVRSRSIQRVSSSFDEPIASAISGRFFEPDQAYSNSTTIPPILPMYPNGVGGVGGAPSFRNSISIPITRKMAGIGDGVSEGVARIRREMIYKAKATGGSSGSGSGGSTRREREETGQPLVPLEFDEEDEDFVVGGGKDILASSGISPGLHNPAAETGPNIVHPSASFVLQPLQLTSEVDGGDVVGAVDEEIWDGGWDMQDRLAVEEQEGFYELDGRGVAPGLGMGMGMGMAGTGGGARTGSGIRSAQIPGANVEGVGQRISEVRVDESGLEDVVRQMRDDSLTDVSSFASPKAARKTKQKRRG